MGGAHTNFKLVTLRNYDYRLLNVLPSTRIFLEALFTWTAMAVCHLAMAAAHGLASRGWLQDSRRRECLLGGISECCMYQESQSQSQINPIGSASARSSSIGGPARDRVRNLSGSLPGLLRSRSAAKGLCDRLSGR